MKIKNKNLIKDSGYINGVWVKSAVGNEFSVVNPATDRSLATVADMTSKDVDSAITAASKAFPLWRSKTAKERAVILKRWFDLIVENQEDLAQILTAEMGKPIAESRGEVAYGASFVEWFAEEGKRIYGDVIPSHAPDRRLIVIKQPIGVVAAITPWNFPSAMITRKVAPALAAGCTVVLKPAAETPLSASALVVLAEQAGLPAGVLNLVITRRSAEVGKVFCSDDRVKKITFTGSTQVGRILMRQSADQIKKLSLELGGNAPFIVFDDADIEAAAQGALACKFRNSGQTCVCANRIYVQSGVYDAFVARFTELVTAMKIGNGAEDGTQQGPMISESAVEKTEAHIKDAVGKGGQLLTGGKRHTLGGTFFEPTVISGATKDMVIASEETFGPVAPVFRFESDEEVIELANNTEYGLASYFYAENMSRVWRVAEALDYGIVGINTGIISTEVAPFGGIKQSGIGREGSRYGIDDFVEIKFLTMAGI